MSERHKHDCYTFVAATTEKVKSALSQMRLTAKDEPVHVNEQESGSVDEDAKYTHPIEASVTLTNPNREQVAAMTYNVLAVAVSCKFEKQKYDNRKTVHRSTKDCRSI